MSWTVDRRHELISLLEDDLADPLRSAAVARSAGLEPVAPQGAETAFEQLSRLVLSAQRAGKLDALVAAAEPAVTEATRVALQGLDVDPGAETDVSEADAPTQRDEADTIIAPYTEPEGAAPRPPGTPTAMAPSDGASSWLVRRVHVGGPTTVAAGGALELTVTLSAADAATVANAPDDATPYAGGAVPVEVELWLEEAFPADGVELHQTLSVDPASESAEIAFAAVAADPLSDGVDVTVRFFVRGHEVGRARAFVPNRDRDDVEPRASAPGAVVVPDTILG